MTAPPDPLTAEQVAEGRAALARLHRFGGESLVAEMARMFLADMPARLALARTALGAAEPARVAYAAHAMKSSAAQFGAGRLAELCAAAERAAADGDLAPVAPLLDRVDGELATFGGWLGAELPAAAPRS